MGHVSLLNCVGRVSCALAVWSSDHVVRSCLTPLASGSLGIPMSKGDGHKILDTKRPTIRRAIKITHVCSARLWLTDLPADSPDLCVYETAVSRFTQSIMAENRSQGPILSTSDPIDRIVPWMNLNPVLPRRFLGAASRPSAGK